MNKILFCLILLLSLLLRVYGLNMLPPSLNWDEVSLGYNSYSILKTGHDEWGEFLPLSFRAYGDYKLPGYIYLDVPFIALFGLNEWGVRLPSALLGVGTVLLIFLIVKKITGRVELALWGMFLTAILPWSVILSRIALEANLALFLTTAGFYGFLVGIKKSPVLILSGFLFGLTIFSYNSSRVVTPLLVFILSVFYWKYLTLKKSLVYSAIALLVFLSFFAIALPKALQQDSSARYKWTTILDEGAINRINELRGSSALPPALTNISYNKVTYFIPEFLKNYLSHFNPDFLLFEGGSNYQFSVPGSGLIYPLVAFFVILGVINIVRKKIKWGFVMTVWVLIGILPAAITRDSPHALRSLMLIPPLVILATLGIGSLMDGVPNKGLSLGHWIKSNTKTLRVLLVGILMVNLFSFWQNYSFDYQRKYSWSWQYGYKQAVDFVNKDTSQYNAIYFTKKYGEPHEFLLFYLKYDPVKYRSDPNLNRYGKSDWFWVDSFDKYVFLNDWEVVVKVKSQKGNGKSLLVTSPGNSPGGQVIKTIDFLDGKRAFDIIELP